MRLFFASDIHGSTTCFRKLVNAGAFYGADVIVMGGDIAGKQLVPIVSDGGRWLAHFRGTPFELQTADEVAEFERRVATVGVYTMRTDSDGVEELRADQEAVESALHRLILDRTQEWVDFAVERLAGTGKRLVLGLGNDDYDDMVPLLERDPVSYAHDGLLDLGDFTLASLGWSNVTPWHTHRECSEEELAVRLAALEAAPDPARTIYNVHVPPFDSGLDTAPRLDENLQVQLVGGEPDMVPVGSTAVAASIRSFEPVLSLHGHIHESRGVVKWGASTVVNPGSEFGEAALLGAVVDVKPGKVKRCQLIAG